MDRSLTDELYSEVYQPKSELVQVSVIDSKQSDSHDESWFDDEELDVSGLNREGGRRRDQFHTVGYRDGVMAGKEAAAQEGFNVGFDESVYVGFKWGLVRGVTSALACLPDGLREKMIQTNETSNKFGQLHESVNSLSTTDALKLFHENMQKKTVKLINIAENSSPTSDSHDQSSNQSLLEHYHGELQSLISETPTIKVHFGEN